MSKNELDEHTIRRLGDAIFGLVAPAIFGGYSRDIGLRRVQHIVPTLAHARPCSRCKGTGKEPPHGR